MSDGTKHPQDEAARRWVEVELPVPDAEDAVVLGKALSE